MSERPSLTLSQARSRAKKNGFLTGFRVEGLENGHENRSHFHGESSENHPLIGGGLVGALMNLTTLNP